MRNIRIRSPTASQCLAVALLATISIPAISLAYLGSYANLTASNIVIEQAQMWYDRWDFQLDPKESDDKYDQLYEAAPWGEDCWGVRGYTWTLDGLFPIHYCRFYSDGDDAYMYGWEDYGMYGVVTYIQGNVWDSTALWNCPDPLPTYMTDIEIGIDLWRDVSTGFEPPYRIMYAVNAWFKSPDLTKRLVMDLAFYVDGTYDPPHHYLNELHNYTDPGTSPNACYHYQAAMYTTGNPTPYRSWQTWKIDLNKHIEGALTTRWENGWCSDELLDPIPNADAVRKSLTLYQLEFILEVNHAWAGCAVDNFYLAYHVEGDVNYEGSVDVFDLDRFGKAYGSSPGSPNWDICCDVNDDKVIDSDDLEAIGDNYGRI